MNEQEMMSNLQERQFKGDTSLMASIMNMGVVNPFIEGRVASSYAKTNSGSFMLALKNGGIYQNTPIFGSNFFYNTLRTVSPSSWKKGSSGNIFSNNSGSFAINKFSSGQVTPGNKHIQYAKNIAENYREANIKSDVVPTGYGYSRDTSKFFKSLNEKGFAEMSGRTSRTAGVELSKDQYSLYNKLKSGETYDDILSAFEASIKSDAHFEKKVSDFKINLEYAKEFIDNNYEWNSTNLSKDITGFIKNTNNFKTDDEIIKIGKEFERATGKTLKSLKNFNESKKGYGAQQITKKYNALRNGEEYVKESFKYSGNIRKELAEELGEQAGNYFASQTVAEKTLGSRFGRTATGVMSGAKGMMIQLPAAILGVVANTKQVNAVQNFVSSYLYNPDNAPLYRNDISSRALNSGINIHASNIDDVQRIIYNKNTASDYLNDLDKLSIENDYKLDSFDLEVRND